MEKEVVRIKRYKLEDLINDVMNIAGGGDYYDPEDMKSAYRNARRIDRALDRFRDEDARLYD